MTNDTVQCRKIPCPSGKMGGYYDLEGTELVWVEKNPDYWQPIIDWMKALGLDTSLLEQL